MGSRTLYLRVGLLIVIGIMAAIGLVLFLKGENFRNAVEMETYFNESVQGLSVGAPVNYLGVTVGRVTDIGLVSAEYFRGVPANLRRATYRMVFVRFVIDPRRIGRTLDPERIANAVKIGFRARVVSQGITGISYLGLDFVDPSRFPPLSVPWTPRYPYVPSVPSTISQVQSAAEQIALQLQQIDFKRIAQTALDLMQAIRAELANGQTHQTLAAATALLTGLREIIEKADLPGLAAGLHEDSKALSAILRSSKISQIATNADHAAAEIALVARTLPPLIASLSLTASRANVTTADFERRMTPILRDLEATASNLRETTNALREYPAGALFGSPPPRSDRSDTGGGR